MKAWMNPKSKTRRRKPSESGYILITVMILLAVFLIAMAVAAPKVAESIQRDRELETMRRGKQYIRAIKLYYNKFHAYPPSLDALVKTNEIRFLRKKYLDPMTGKDDWKPIMFCQNKTPVAMGFFGQPLGAAGCGALAGTAAGGGPGLFPTSGTGTTTAGPTGSAGASQGVGLFSSTGAGTGSTGTGSDSGTGSSSGAGAVDANGNPINTTGSPLGTGQTFGGGGIIGVEPISPKQSILVYKKKNHYNEWEFLYSPLSDQQMIVGGNAGGINPTGSGVNQNGQNNSLFNQNGQGGGINQNGGGINQNGGGISQPTPNGPGPGNTPVMPPDTPAPPPQ
jgi:type II secretory pathway pseudopilin PulG